MPYMYMYNYKLIIFYLFYVTIFLEIIIVKIKGRYLSSVNKLLGIHSHFFHKISEQPDRIVN